MESQVFSPVSGSSFPQMAHAFFGTSGETSLIPQLAKQAFDEQVRIIESIREKGDLLLFAPELDFLEDGLRCAIWQRLRQLFAGTEEEPEPTFHFFAPFMAEVRDQHSLISRARPHLRAPLDRACQCLIQVIQEFRMNIATSIVLRGVFSVSMQPMSEERPIPADRMAEDDDESVIPECCDPLVLPPQHTSPFGCGIAATQAQYRCLSFWAIELDALPLAVKTAIWRVCKVKGPDFGFDHDIQSFLNTITHFGKTIEAHARPIAILFSAIGMLRNNGNIATELCWPDQPEGVRLSVFHGTRSEKVAERHLRRHPELDELRHARPLRIDLIGREMFQQQFGTNPTPLLPSFSELLQQVSSEGEFGVAHSEDVEMKETTDLPECLSSLDERREPPVQSTLKSSGFLSHSAEIAVNDLLGLKRPCETIPLSEQPARKKRLVFKYNDQKAILEYRE